MYLKYCAALLFITPAAFATSVDLRTQLQSCQQISGEEQRLSCFDQIVANLDIARVVVPAQQRSDNTLSTPTRVTEATRVQSTQVASSAVSIVTAPAPQYVNDGFGLKKPDPVDEIQEMVSTVQTVATDKRKKSVITLANGQQWQQIDQGYIRIKIGDRCTIERGAIGSFFLRVDGITKKIRVRRVE